MHLSEYQRQAKEFATYPTGTVLPCYTIIALAGEVGELANEIKKVMRGDYGKIGWLEPGDDKEIIKKLVEELGDVLWYVSAIANDLGVTLDDVATRNLCKLENRHGPTG